MINLIPATVILSLSVLPPVKKVVVAYVPNWIDLDAFVQTIDYDKITHINIAFENPIDDAGDLSSNPKNQLIVDRAHREKIKVLISIGGGSASADKEMMTRYFRLISSPNRTAFAAKLADYVEKHNYDGLDVDLEGPSINDDYGDFIAELSKALKRKKKLLTCALSQGYGGDKVPQTALQTFDLVNIMAYDGAGNWSPDRPGQHSSLEFAQQNAQYWLKRGVAKSKAVLGVPFYGYGFGKAFRDYGYPYSEIVATYPGAEKLNQVGETIWHNGIPTIQAKAKYVLEQDLAGVMIWSLDQDVQGEKSLLTALTEALKVPK